MIPNTVWGIKRGTMYRKGAVSYCEGNTYGGTYVDKEGN